MVDLKLSDFTKTLLVTLIPTTLVMILIIASIGYTIFAGEYKFFDKMTDVITETITTDLESSFNKIINLSKTTAAQLSNINPDQEDARAEADEVIKSILKSSLIANYAWFVFEPNAFDNRDLQSGRFMKSYQVKDKTVDEINFFSENDLKNYKSSLKFETDKPRFDGRFLIGKGSNNENIFAMVYLHPIIRDGKTIGTVAFGVDYKYLIRALSAFENRAGQVTLMVTWSGDAVYYDAEDFRYVYDKLLNFVNSPSLDASIAIGKTYSKREHTAFFEGLCYVRSKPINFELINERYSLVYIAEIEAVNKSASVFFIKVIFGAVIVLVITVIFAILTGQSKENFVAKQKMINRRKELKREIFEFADGAGYEMGRSLRKIELLTYETNKISKQRIQFLSTISHELRTPMNAIIGISRFLAEDLKDEVAKNHAQEINIAAQALLVTINHILDFAKIEAGKYKIVERNFSVKSFIYKVNTVVEFLAKEKVVELEISVSKNVPECLYGDDMVLGQIVVEFLSSAIENSNNCKIILNVDYKDEKLEFRLCNTEDGVLSEYFDKVNTIQNLEDDETMGVALKILIIKKFIELIKADLSLVKNDVYGDTIYLDVHFLEGDASKLEEKSYKMFEAPSAKVLVIDDFEMNLTVIQTLLDSHEIKSDVQTSARVGIELLKNNDYDLVIMDHMMPDLDGMEAVKIIRELGGKFKDIPIIVATANIVHDIGDEYFKAGFNDIVLKPIESHRFIKILNKWLPSEKIVYSREKEDIEFNVPIELNETLKKMNNLGGLDISKGLARVNNNQDVYVRTIRIFQTTLVQKIQNMQKYLGTQSLGELATDAHGIKGSLANIGESQIAPIAKEMEFAAKDKDFGRCQSLMPVLVKQLSDFSEVLTQVLAKNDEEREIGGKELLKNVTEGVIIYLNDFDRASALTELLKLQKFSFGYEIDLKLAELNSATESYDYDFGIKVAEEILDLLQR